MSNKSFQSVFDGQEKIEKEFDQIFKMEEDIELVDVACGFKENGEVDLGADFEELHQTDDDATPKDFEKELGPDHDSKNKPTIDSEGEFEIDDDISLDLGCPKYGVADAVTKTEPNNEEIEDEAEKAAKKFDESSDLDGDIDQTPEIEENPGDQLEPVKAEGCKKESGEDDDDDEKSEVDKLEDEIDEEMPEVDKLEDDIDDDDDDDDDDDSDDDDEKDDDKDDDKDDKDDDDEKEVEESTNLVDALDDDIIDEVEEEDDTTSKSEVDKLEKAASDDDLIELVVDED